MQWTNKKHWLKDELEGPDRMYRYFSLFLVEFKVYLNIKHASKI